MNNIFNEIQKTWHMAKYEPTDLNQLVFHLNRMESKSKRERILLLILFPLTITVLFLLLPFTKSYYYLMAILLIGIGMLMILFQMYQSKINHHLSIDTLNSKEFINSLIVKYQRKIQITSRYMWIYAILFILGLNCGYIEILKETTLFNRIFVHFALTGIFTSFMYSAIRKRNRKNKREILPLLENLYKIQNNLTNV